MSNPLTFSFRGQSVPVTFNSSITPEQANQAIQAEPFRNWIKECEQEKEGKYLNIKNVELQSIDFFGARGVGFIKLKSTVYLHDGPHQMDHHLPGICFLRGNAVSIFVALVCEEDKSVYSLLVQQPRVPVGQVACLEVPAGMVDDERESVTGIAVKEMEEECGIKVKPSDLVDLTRLAFGNESKGIAPSPGGCDEHCRFMYLEKKVTQKQLDEMKEKMVGLRDHGEYITLTVVPYKDVWKISADMKAMVSLFLLERLRQEGKLPPLGEMSTPI